MTTQPEPAAEHADSPPFTPPQWFIDNYHEKNPDAPRRSRLDPVMVALWHQVTLAPPLPQQLCLVTGI